MASDIKSAAMLLDVSKCMACRGCQAACKQWNDLPAEKTHNRGSYQNPAELSADTWTLIRFEEVSAGDKVAWLFRKEQCLHCTEASCVSVCPTGAAAHHGEFVLFDQEQCIGCGYCVQACPFDVPHLDAPAAGEEKGTARKCTFCIDRVTNGYSPACAQTCPTGAVRFGERGDLLALGRKRVSELQAKGRSEAYLYGEKELGGLGVMYVLENKPAMYGLPESPRMATRNVLGSWLSGILTAGVVAAVPFWLLFRRKEALAAQEGGE